MTIENHWLQGTKEDWEAQQAYDTDYVDEYVGHEPSDDGEK